MILINEIRLRDRFIVTKLQGNKKCQEYQGVVVFTGNPLHIEMQPKSLDQKLPQMEVKVEDKVIVTNLMHGGKYFGEVLDINTDMLLIHVKGPLFEM